MWYLIILLPCDSVYRVSFTRLKEKILLQIKKYHMKVEFLSTLQNRNCQQIGYVQAVFPTFKSCVGVPASFSAVSLSFGRTGTLATLFILEVNVSKASTRYPSRGLVTSCLKFKYIEKIPPIMTVYLNLIMLIKMISLSCNQLH